MGDVSAATAPVFVGGTGRSGTTIVGQLIGHSAAFELVPTEVRFHTDPGGMPDLIAGRIDVDQFAENMRTKWYRRRANRNGPRGVHVVADQEVFDAALARLRENYAADGAAAAGQFVHDLLDGVGERAGKPSWVEMTPPVAHAMDSLYRILPDAKFVHMMRDGRDVASSVVPRGWGPNDLPGAMEWWADEMIAIGRAEAQVPAGQLLRMRMESLVGPNREVAYERLRTFLGVDDDPGMRAFFEESVTGRKAKRGRWRNERDDTELDEVEKLYEVALGRLEEAGVALAEVD